MAVTWDQATWDSAYRIRIRDPSHGLFGQTVGYTRLGMGRVLDPYSDSLDLFIQRWANLTRDFPIQAAERILIAGCAFGFLIEAAHDAGFPNVWGIDNSSYVAANGPTESSGSVAWVQDDFTGGGRIRNELKQLTGDNVFDWVISEDVLTSYTDAECVPLFNAAETVIAGVDLSQIIHMVTEAPVNAPFTSHTLEEWKALRPAHSFVSVRLSQWRVL